MHLLLRRCSWRLMDTGHSCTSREFAFSQLQTNFCHFATSQKAPHPMKKVECSWIRSSCAAVATWKTWSPLSDNVISHQGAVPPPSPAITVQAPKQTAHKFNPKYFLKKAGNAKLRCLAFKFLAWAGLILVLLWFFCLHSAEQLQ